MRRPQNLKDSLTFFCSNVKTSEQSGRLLQIFVAFSEYLNFNVLRCRWRLKIQDVPLPFLAIIYTVGLGLCGIHSTHSWECKNDLCLFPSVFTVQFCSKNSEVIIWRRGQIILLFTWFVKKLIKAKLFQEATLFSSSFLLT